MAMEVAKQVWNLDPGGAYCYLVEGTDACLVIDTGLGGVDILSQVEKLVDRRPGRPRFAKKKPVHLVNTHYHMDHTGGNGAFAAAYAHPAEFDRLRPTVSKLLPAQEGLEFSLGGRTLRVIECPGHTPGGIALLDLENRLLFSGDMLATVPIWMQGADADLHAYIRSMDKLSALADHVDTVLGCHGPMPQTLALCAQLKALAQGILDGAVPGKLCNLQDAGGPNEDIRLCKLGDVSMLRPL